MNANPAQEPPILERSPIVRFLRWLFRLRTLGFLVFGLLTLVTLVAAFYIFELWRGKRAWESYRAAMTAKGERLDFAAYIPPAVPDEQNFATTSFLAPLFDFLPGTQTWRDTNAYHRIQARGQAADDQAKIWGFRLGVAGAGRWEKGERTDLVALLGTNENARGSASAATGTAKRRPATQSEAAVILLDLLKETFDPELEELRAASEWPHCRYNIRYDNPPVVAIKLPHLAVVKGIVIKVAWRASAQLALGRTNEAFEDIMLGLYITDSLKNEPILISHLVRVACRAILTQPIWNGMTAHQWSDLQLRRLQAGLEKDDFPADSQRALKAERAGFGVLGIQQVITRAGGICLDDLLENSGKIKWQHLLVPTGWLYLEMRNLSSAFRLYLEPFDDWRSGKLNMDGFLRALAQGEKQFEGMSGWKAILLEHRFLSALFLPAVGKIHHKGLLAQVRSDQTFTACALERYFLANGSYPETLEALVPKYVASVPTDIMSGRPMVYQRQGPRSYQLYSVGKNLMDDGGQVVVNKGGSVNVEQGDWVWLQPGL